MSKKEQENNNKMIETLREISNVEPQLTCNHFMKNLNLEELD